MTWLLVILAIAFDGGPDQAFKPPIERPGFHTMDECLDAAEEVARRSAVDLGRRRISLVFECRKEEAST